MARLISYYLQNQGEIVTYLRKQDEAAEQGRAIAAQVTETREENVRLKANLEYTERKLRETQERLEKAAEQLTKRIEALSLQAGREYARGFVEGLREHKYTSAKE